MAPASTAVHVVASVPPSLLPELEPLEDAPLDVPELEPLDVEPEDDPELEVAPELVWSAPESEPPSSLPLPPELLLLQACIPSSPHESPRSPIAKIDLRFMATTLPSRRASSIVGQIASIGIATVS